MTGKRYTNLLFLFTIILVILLFVLMNVSVFGNLGAYFFLPNKLQWFKQYVSPTKTTPVPLQSLNEKTVRLAAQNNSNESGTAILKEVNGQVVVTLTLTGAPQQAAQPAHIHLGACPNPGAIKYPLTSPVNGKSVSTIPVNMAELMDKLPLAINVHKSATNISTYVSCGDLAN